MVGNPDSWEGWLWGAVHHWGQTGRLGGGETYGTVEDCLQNAELIVFWSSDPEATSGIYGAQEGTVRRAWLKELGIPMVHIDPFFNHTAAWLGGKWMAPRPGTDSALVLAIAHVWITEDLYDKEYVAERTVGFDRWKAYILGEDDGVPKTPEWQEKRDRHSRARREGAGSRLGRQEDLPVARGLRGLRRRLPYGHGHRLGAGHGVSHGHAGPGQAGRQHGLPAAGHSGRDPLLLPRLRRGRHVGRARVHGACPSSSISACRN